MIRFRLYFDKDKETKWLNEMSNLGWAMSSFFAGFYKFEPCSKGEYTYQIDFGNKFFSISDDYKEFMEDSDIEIVQTWGFWVFLRKIASKGDFVLYSDVDSQIEHYKKIKLMFKIVTIIELLGFFYELFAAIQLHSPIIWGFALIILSLVVAFVRATLRTGNIIQELTERKTGIEQPKNRNVSLLLSFGLILNSFALMMPETFSLACKHAIQIVAIVLMIIGIYHTSCRRSK